MKINELTADELLENYRSHKLSPVDAVGELFRFIEEKNPQVNAFVTLNKEQALAQAKESEQRFLEGETIRPLEGIPIAIKDLVNTKGIRTTFGSLIYKDFISDHDATAVKRLKDAGAVIMGKTNTPEFGYKGTTENLLFGPSRNPWNLAKQTGGSSGGSAAAVASGFVPLAQGGDGGGSIRIPSAFCGIYGFKPTFGRVPIDNHLHGVFSNHHPFIHWGPMARTATDAALMLDVMQGSAPTDPFSLPKMESSLYDLLKNKERNDFVIGYTEDFGIFEIEAEIKDVFLNTIEALREFGLRVEPVQVSMKKTAAEYMNFFNKLWAIHISGAVAPLLKTNEKELPEDLKILIQKAEGLSAIEFEALGEYRAYLYQTIESLFDTYDVLLTPTLISVDVNYDAKNPVKLNGLDMDRELDSMLHLTSLLNLTGHPAASLPIGFTKQGGPVGMQAVCKRLDEVTLFQFAKWVEGHFKTPTLAKL